MYASCNCIPKLKSTHTPPDLGNIDAALHEFDTVLYHNAVKDSVFGLLDATSLLWRLEIVGVDPGEDRWQKVTGNFSQLIGQHAVAWFVPSACMSIVYVDSL